MAKGRRIDPDTAALLKGTAEHAEASRDLVDLTQREIAEAREHVDRSEVAIVESRKRIKRLRDPIPGKAHWRYCHRQRRGLGGGQA